MRPPTVIFQVTAIGRNVRAIETSVRSVLYWVRNTPRLGFRAVVWVVVEPDGYATSPDLYASLRREGVTVRIVPAEYRTPGDTRGKGRALHFACETRTRSGWSSPDVWVYHQDEETCVGQDTLQGISDFLRQGDARIGVGVILYPLDWSGTPSHIQELTRSFDDFRVLDSMTQPGNPTAGFHGSHLLARADLEDSVGWDAPGYAPAEDLLFEIRVRARYGTVFGVLKGFAYEKGAFSLRDQLRQRRRWVHGVVWALFRSPELTARRRATLAYSAVSWFTALPALALLIASIVVHYGPLLLVTGLFTGFVWMSMILGYVEGYRIHAAYIDRSIPLSRLIPNGILGALVDVVAPWFALVTRPSLGDFIIKDRPDPARARTARRPSGLEAVPGPVAITAASETGSDPPRSGPRPNDYAVGPNEPPRRAVLARSSRAAGAARGPPALPAVVGAAILRVLPGIGGFGSRRSAGSAKALGPVGRPASGDSTSAPYPTCFAERFEGGPTCDGARRIYDPFYGCMVDSLVRLSGPAQFSSCTWTSSSGVGTNVTPLLRGDPTERVDGQMVADGGRPSGRESGASASPGRPGSPRGARVPRPPRPSRAVRAPSGIRGSR